MDEIIEELQQRVLAINNVLKTQNLTPIERGVFLRMKERLNGTIQRHVQDALKQKLQIEADKRIEQDLPAIAGESLPHGSGFRLPGQLGGVKTYEQEIPATTIRKFHPNINLDTDRRMQLRRLVKKHLSNI